MTILPYLLGLIVIAAIAVVGWLCRSTHRKAELCIAHLQEQIAGIRVDLSELSKDCKEQKHELWKPAMPMNGFNLNRRPDAVRRLRAGHTPEHVANGTGWSTCDVELLKKVEGLVRVRAAG